MPISMFDAGPARLIVSLRNLIAILDKAAAHVAENKIDPSVLLGARLYPDMFPFTRQVQQACSTVETALARIAGVEAVKHDNAEVSFDELKARIGKAIAFLEGIPPAAINETADKEFALKLPRGDVRWTGLQYLFGFVVPNFYFHMTTAYDILRHNGVRLGKLDFIPNPAA